MHWVAAEATATAAALHAATGDPSYAAWYATWWDHLAEVFIDHELGSWRHELDPQNRPSGVVWNGKPDTLPRVPGDPDPAPAAHAHARRRAARRAARPGLNRRVGRGGRGLCRGPPHYPRDVQPDSDDDAWRSIVDNYGDRVDLGPGDAPPPPTDDAGDDPDGRRRRAGPRAGPGPDVDEPARTTSGTRRVRAAASPAAAVRRPRPAARLDRRLRLPRRAAGRRWCPASRCRCWLGYLLVAAFVGGFLYLVTRMPRGPRDPADDGARL